MDITPYVDSLRHDLVAAAEAGGPESRGAAERLALALDPAVRLALMDALSQAAAEITSELSTGSVDVRLRGREPQFVVDVPTIASAPLARTPLTPPTSLEAEEDEEDGAVARITLRIPEFLKSKAEELAGKSGHSLNTWIVHTVRDATRERAVNVDIDLSSLPFLEGAQRWPTRSGNRRMSGWV
ncbi:MAG: pilus assembly protein HicB [Actinomycetota bacterium]|nr:pilus assembly protein HicB [Actinomycetota bacterium]